MKLRSSLAALLAVMLCFHALGAQPDSAGNIASLIQQAKLATLGPRDANSRIQKVSGKRGASVWRIRGRAMVWA